MVSSFFNSNNWFDNSLKVPKCEILDLLDCHDFYTIKPFWVDNFSPRIEIFSFEITYHINSCLEHWRGARDLQRLHHLLLGHCRLHLHVLGVNPSSGVLLIIIFIFRGFLTIFKKFLAWLFFKVSSVHICILLDPDNRIRIPDPDLGFMTQNCK